MTCHGNDDANAEKACAHAESRVGARRVGLLTHLEEEVSRSVGAVSLISSAVVWRAPRRRWRHVMSKEPSVAQKLMGDFAPKLLQLTDEVLFGDVWERPELSKRDRSLITVSALIALNRPDQLRRHLQRARDNGLTRDEIVETITHLAFYAGWPNAMTAVLIAKEVFE